MVVVMVDWISARAPECFDGDITGGSVMKIDPDGQIEWCSHSKKILSGSHSSKVAVRQIRADYSQENIDVPGRRSRSHGCVIEGNLTKFLNGHNLVGSGDATELLTAALEKIGASIGQPPWPFDFGESDLTRIDLTDSWMVDRPSDVLPFLDAMAERCHVPYRGRAVAGPNGPGTLYWGYKKAGERASPWQFKIYAKGREAVKWLPQKAMEIPGLLDDLARTIRVELTLRTPELKRLGLTKAKHFTPETSERIWKEYVGKIDFGEFDMTLDTHDLAETGMKPRLVDAVAAWKSGNDLRAGRSRSAWYQLRNEIRDACGIDIATSVPTSNVIPLRRVIVAKPAHLPSWAGTLQRVMSNVA